jgi:hypothetical protein
MNFDEHPLVDWTSIGVPCFFVPRFHLASKLDAKKKNRPRAICARAVDLTLFLSWHRREARVNQFSSAVDRQVVNP